jgi:hypothetical protein
MMRAMDICHAHNLNREPAERRRFGVRVRLTSADPLSRLLGGELDKTHWFATASERDRALADMAGEHLYSRRGDRPSLRFEPVDRS